MSRTNACGQGRWSRANERAGKHERRQAMNGADQIRGERDHYWAVRECKGINRKAHHICDKRDGARASVKEREGTCNPCANNHVTHVSNTGVASERPSGRAPGTPSDQAQKYTVAPSAESAKCQSGRALRAPRDPRGRTQMGAEEPEQSSVEMAERWRG